jgi:hypothetical protein
MPGPYRKKRRIVGPSKNEEKVERSRQQEAMGRGSNSIGSRYPEVKSMKVALTFTGAQQQSLGGETRSYGPQDPCVFSVPCPGMCGVGAFDLAGKVAQVVEAHSEVSEGSGVCQERLHTGAPCGCTLKVRLEVAYRPAPAAPAPTAAPAEPAA